MTKKSKMTTEELKAVCDKDCKKRRIEKIVSIVYTIVKVVAGVIIGQNVG